MSMVKVHKEVMFLYENWHVAVRRPNKHVTFMIKKTGHIYTENTYRCHFIEGRKVHVCTEGT